MTQVSARDINVTSRAATGTLATGLLALLDGRSLYQDMFGFVMWDFLPVNLNEIKQIEVHSRTGLRGVGRERALRRRQRDHQIAARDAGHQRDVRHWRRSPAATIVGRARCGTSAAPTRRPSTIAGPSSCRPVATPRIRFARPTGTIPCDRPEVCTVPTATYPPFTNSGTTQPKFDATSRLRLSRRRQVIVHRRRRRHRRHHAHAASARSTSRAAPSWATVRQLLEEGAARRVLHQHPPRRCRPTCWRAIRSPASQSRSPSTRKTYDFDASNVQHRSAHITRSITAATCGSTPTTWRSRPQADNRTEFGAYVQDEMFLSKYFRLNLGARVDSFDYLDDWSCSRRARRF